LAVAGYVSRSTGPVCRVTCIHVLGAQDPPLHPVIPWRGVTRSLQVNCALAGAHIRQIGVGLERSPCCFSAARARSDCLRRKATGMFQIFAQFIAALFSFVRNSTNSIWPGVANSGQTFPEANS